MVRNEALLGQIIACPRCESMVQVERPQASTASTPQHTAAEVPPQPVEVPEPSAIADSTSASPLPTTDSVTQTEPPSPPQSPPATPVTAFSKSKLLGWTLAAFTAGAAVTGIVLYFNQDDPLSIQTSTASTATQSVIDKPVTEELVPDEASERESNSEEQVTKETPLESSATLEEDSAVEQPVIELQQKEQPTANVETASNPGSESVEEAPEVARKFNPFQYDPENLDINTIKNDPATSVKSLVVEDPVAELASTVEPQADNLLATLPKVRRDANQVVSPAVAVEQLQQKFPSIRISKMPLGEFLHLISQLAGVPVSVAPQELQMAGITARKQVSLNAKDFDLKQALEQAIKPLQLQVVVEGPLVRIVRKDGAKLREVTYPLNDLSSVANAAEIAALVEQLVVPDQWQAVGGQGTLELSGDSLKVNQVQWIQYQVLIFLERLRITNQLPPRSRFPMDKFGAKSAYATLASHLQAPTVFTFSHYTPLQEVIRHWQTELAVPILVDWPALAELDLWPQTRLTCSIDSQPWPIAFNEVLDPLGLAWRTAPGGMIEITTSQKSQSQPLLEMFLLSNAPAGGADQLLAELNAQLEDSVTNAQFSAFNYDEAAKLLLVLQPAEVQRKTYQWLTKHQLIKAN